MTYVEFVASFRAKYESFNVPEGATECGPYIFPTVRPDLPPWKLFWCICYPDANYIRINEYYDVDRGMGSQHGRRVSFGYHYGPFTPSEVDENGCPKRRKKTHIRFDVSFDQYQAHMHHGDEDHILQSRVGGITISTLDLFSFISGIEQHRNTHMPLLDCFSVTIDSL